MIQDTVAPATASKPSVSAWLTSPSATGRSTTLTHGRRLAAASIGASLYPFFAVAFTPLVGTAGAISGLLGLAVGIVIAGLIVPARSATEWATVGAMTFGLGLALGVVHLLMMLGVAAAA